MRRGRGRHGCETRYNDAAEGAVLDKFSAASVTHMAKCVLNRRIRQTSGAVSTQSAIAPGVRRLSIAGEKTAPKKAVKTKASPDKRHDVLFCSERGPVSIGLKLSPFFQRGSYAKLKIEV